MSEVAIQLASRENCTGCGACANACSFQVISMQADDAGFRHPAIDSSKCVTCHACEQACPVLHVPQSGFPEPLCYAAWAEDDIRMRSSSGGVFSVLAQEVLRAGGAVAGAAQESDLTVRHVLIEKETDLPALLGSKYVQSDAGDIYRRVRAVLQKGRQVLFSGTPCQIAGLKAYLKRTPENLLLVETLCHGVPSAKMLLDYLAEQGLEEKISSVWFRDKNRGWLCNELTLCSADGIRDVIAFPDCAFEQGFHYNAILRRSCYDCPFGGKSRQADLTLGDFWGIEGFEPSWNDGKGTSLVLCNTEKGSAWWKRISPMLQRTAAVLFSYCEVNRVHEKIPGREKRAHFDLLRRKETFTKAAGDAANARYDIGLIGCWSVENHGSNMAYYALYRTLTDMGYQVLMIERPLSALWQPKNAKACFAQSPYPEYALAPFFANKWAMHALNDQCDTFVLGSDQLLYHDLYRSFDEFADMDYIHADKRKIAYAASIGRDSFEGTEAQRKKLTLNLKKFDAISVREHSAVSAAAESFDVRADWVLDPVFLCGRDYYDRMADTVEAISERPYIAVYILDPTPEKEAALRFLSQECRMPLVAFSDVARSAQNVQDAWKIDTIDTATNEKWLRAIRDADLLVTDSFHGTCFALLFQKNFISVCNPHRGAARFESLLGELSLTGRLIQRAEDIPKHPELMEAPDYKAVSQKLDMLAQASRLWLRTALQAPHKTNITDADLQGDQIAALTLRLNEVERRGLTTETWLSNTHKRVDACEERLTKRPYNGNLAEQYA